ncbi:hypothetical protein R1flu_014794 [Riccia fluitans]|uniref:Uncharacterized protein n=1 Tax=Riccia fluitans TaxID=41844 RepID=A0ABD1YH43_9MARC
MIARDPNDTLSSSNEERANGPRGGSRRRLERGPRRKWQNLRVQPSVARNSHERIRLRWRRSDMLLMERRINTRKRQNIRPPMQRKVAKC